MTFLLRAISTPLLYVLRLLPAIKYSSLRDRVVSDSQDGAKEHGSSRPIGRDLDASVGLLLQRNGHHSPTSPLKLGLLFPLLMSSGMSTSLHTCPRVPSRRFNS